MAVLDNNKQDRFLLTGLALGDRNCTANDGVKTLAIETLIRSRLQLAAS